MKAGLKSAFQSRTIKMRVRQARSERSIARLRAHARLFRSHFHRDDTVSPSPELHVYPACGGGDDTRAVAAASGRTRTASDSDRRRIARLGEPCGGGFHLTRPERRGQLANDGDKIGDFNPEMARLLARARDPIARYRASF